MPNVHSTDAYTWLDIVPEATYNTDPGSGYLRVPLLGETMSAQRRPVEQTREIKPAGGQSTGAYGQMRTEGVIRTGAYYNAPWLHLLLCHAMGGMEERTLEQSPGGTPAPGEAIATHRYLPQSYKQTEAGSIGGKPVGMTIRGGKAGPSNPAGSSIERFTGSILRSVSFLHRFDGVPEFAFGVIGNKSSRVSASGVSPPTLASYVAVAPNHIKINKDGVTDKSLVTAGDTSPNFEVTEIGWTLETPIEFPEPYANDLDGDYEPAIVGNRRVTGRLGFRLHQTHLADGKALNEYLLGTLASKVRIRYASGAFGTGPGLRIGANDFFTYVMDFAFSNVQWANEADWQIKGPGPIQGAIGFNSFEFAYTSAGTSVPAGQQRKGMIMVQIQVESADDGSGKFVAAAAGGNDLHSTLT